MRAIIAFGSRQAQVLLAGGGLLLLAACASEPAQIGTPEYALQRLFSTRPARSMDQLLAAQRPRAEGPASASGAATANAAATPSEAVEPERGSEADIGTPLPIAAGVTIIEMNEWPIYPAAGIFAVNEPYYDPRAYASYPLRPYRPGYYGVRGPGGYRRCFGNCGGLSLAIGPPNARLRLNAGSSSTVSTSTVIVQPPLR